MLLYSSSSGSAAPFLAFSGPTQEASRSGDESAMNAAASSAAAGLASYSPGHDQHVTALQTPITSSPSYSAMHMLAKTV